MKYNQQRQQWGRWVVIMEYREQLYDVLCWDLLCSQFNSERSIWICYLNLWPKAYSSSVGIKGSKIRLQAGFGKQVLVLPCSITWMWANSLSHLEEPCFVLLQCQSWHLILLMKPRHLFHAVAASEGAWDNSYNESFLNLVKLLVCSLEQRKANHFHHSLSAGDHSYSWETYWKVTSHVIGISSFLHEPEAASQNKRHMYVEAEKWASVHNLCYFWPNLGLKRRGKILFYAFT